MEKTHKIGEYVTYRNNGICKIKNIVKQNFPGVGENEYYELAMVYDERNVIFVPVNSEILTAQMRRILSPEEIEKIITKTENEENCWIDDTRERSQAFGEILHGGDRAKILWVIKALSIYKKELEEKKKKLYASDTKLLATAEKIITEEFAFVLGIKKDEVIPFITERIKSKKS